MVPRGYVLYILKIQDYKVEKRKCYLVSFITVLYATYHNYLQVVTVITTFTSD